MFSILSNTVILMFVLVITSFENSKVFSQNIPSIACPDIFQYLNYGNSYIGKITLYGAPLSTIKVEAQFSQRESITTNYNGRLSLFEGLSATQSNLQNGKPIAYRVDFPNSNLLPKLTRIKVNEQTVCSDYGFPPPSTTFSVHHTFYPSTSTFSGQSNLPHIVNPMDDYFVYTFGNDLGSNSIFNGFDTRQQNTAPTPQRPTTNSFIPNRQNPTNINTRVVPPIAAPAPAPRPRPTPAPAPAQAKAPNIATICGQEGSSLTPFIVGGNDFERGRFPWLTAIYVRHSADLKFTCGGSLISTRTVVTAAHCFQDAQISADRIVVYLGRHNLYSSEIGVEQHDIQTLIKHPEFNASAMSDADIALLHMSAPVGFTQFIRPICLWSSSFPLSQQNGFVAGWGADNNGHDVTSVPKMVEVNIVSENVCLRSSDIFRTLTSSRSLCAGKRDGTGPCIGDSGGGLMIYSAGRWALRAVTSLGITTNSNNRKSCNLNEFVVYCDLSKHANWVHRNMLQ